MTTPPIEPDDTPEDMSPQARELLASQLEAAAQSLRDNRAVVRRSSYGSYHNEPSHLDVNMSWWEPTGIPDSMEGPRPDPRTGEARWGSSET